MYRVRSSDKGLREAYLERGGAYEKVEVSDVSVQPDAVYMTISVCRDRNTAETLRNHYISVDREHAVKLPEGRYFVADMIGCDVYDTNGAYYGKLTDVLETGANDVYVIQGEKQLMVGLSETFVSGKILGQGLHLKGAVYAVWAGYKAYAQILH